MGGARLRTTVDRRTKGEPITTIGLDEVQLITGLSAKGVGEWVTQGHVIKLTHGVYDLPATVRALMSKARGEGAKQGGGYQGEFDLNEERARKEHYLANEAEHRLAIAKGESVPVGVAVGWISELIANLKSQVRGLDVPEEVKRSILEHIRSVVLPDFAAGKVDTGEDEL